MGLAATFGEFLHRPVRTPGASGKDDAGPYVTLVGLGFFSTPFGRVERGAVMKLRDFALARELVACDFAAIVPKGKRPADVLAESEIWDD